MKLFYTSAALLKVSGQERQETQIRSIKYGISRGASNYYLGIWRANEMPYAIERF